MMGRSILYRAETVCMEAWPDLSAEQQQQRNMSSQDVSGSQSSVSHHRLQKHSLIGPDYIVISGSRWLLVQTDGIGMQGHVIRMVSRLG